MDIDLANYMISERFKTTSWPPSTDEAQFKENGKLIKRRVPQRALSDIIESLLGAAWCSGHNLSSALQISLNTGTALTVCFGGTQLWHLRPEATPQYFEPALPRHRALEDALRYRFRNGKLLTEALTHRSCTEIWSDRISYERLEFLGDAVIVCHLYRNSRTIKSPIRTCSL